LIIAQQAFLKIPAAAPAAGVGALICDATIRIGWVQAGSLKPARIPPTVLEALKQ
jgi:acyl-CoA thioester hydrolase